jgi:hypothetical protein
MAGTSPAMTEWRWTPFAAFWLADERDPDFPSAELAHELVHCQVSEIVPADCLHWDDGGAVILRHEEKRSVHVAVSNFPALDRAVVSAVRRG